LTVDEPRQEPSPPRAGVWAVIVAGGNGTRFGRRKQFADLAGRPVLAWSIGMARRACSGVVVVLPPPVEAEPHEPGEPMTVAEAAGHRPGRDEGEDPELMEAFDLADKIVTGGTLRSDSVRAGLRAVPDDAEIVAVHDAARPLAGLPIWLAVLDAVSGGADGAVPVVAVSDTVTQVHPDGSRRAVDRTTLRAVQTPQAFRADVLRRAHEAGADATDDATLVEAVGGRVELVDGHPVNLKITMPSDLAVAAALLSLAEDR
jgi:2-C-methyl-D-erythritol 4-phosphate cytidylyltransferase